MGKIEFIEEPLYYHKDGTPYKSASEWAVDLEMPDRIVKQTVLPNGKFVSTIWLGLNYAFFRGKLEIFETMVFPKKGNFKDLDCERYATEEEAKKGHSKMVKKWS